MSACDGFEVGQVGSWFQTQGPATEKARSLSLSLVDCFTRSMLLVKRFDVRPDITDASSGCEEVL